ncbi:MAG TPA: thymidine phosphorylase, partial [Candidatus Fimenecus stercoravium]|nr:thymidine phosphorylase [Candidatus Fimenecus stercoravium]
MQMADLLNHKKAGLALTAAEIEYFVSGFTAGKIPDYQAAALLMAICLRGMTDEEAAVLTDCMARSGDQLDLSPVDGVTADKHSTGGVGDKTTLIVAPLCAAAGLKIAKMSGRGLGHTGGTVDKLESIPGFRVALSNKEFFEQVNRVGVSVIGQTGNLAPADKKIYALRDATQTVDSIALIAASIMSKKLAAGAQNLVLDVKCGSGAFMETAADAQHLARLMVEIGKRCGRRVTAVITDMDTPLGTHIGNALEVTEALEILQNGGDENLRTLCLVLSAQLLQSGLRLTAEEARQKAEQTLKSGAAYAKFLE